MHDQETTPSRFLTEKRDLWCHEIDGEVLDLACGGGRNALYMAEQGFQVRACDRSEESLATLQKRAEDAELAIDCFQVDLESVERPLTESGAFGAILVFRYLHRPLFPNLFEALKPGGLLIYETFTSAQAQFGRPKNPLFLLKPGELATLCQELELIYSWEGVEENPKRAVAQIIARKPHLSGS
ncbi:MAG: methyltransferase domain-containing protein [Planctomycetota bacterium]|nr:methyltransferase domain-containing protein [Planctomycetota bacterium]